MSQNRTFPLITGRKHTIGNTTFIVNSYAASEGSRSAAELIMDMLISTVRSKEVSI